MKFKLFLLVVGVVGFVLFSWRNTFAYFSSVFIIPGNTISVRDLSATTSAHIVINEVSPTGTAAAEWVELYNPTTSVVDISGWKIHDNSGVDTIPINTTIPANGYGVIVSNNNSLIISPPVLEIKLDSVIGGGLATGGDEIALNLPDDLTRVDAVSWGSDTSIFSGVPAVTDGNTLQRIPNGVDTDSANDWKLGSSTMGAENQ